MRARSLSLVLLAAILVTVLLSAPPPTHANVGRASTAPTMSAVNEVPDFYVKGDSAAYSLEISPRGGFLSIGGSANVFFTPWGYVTTKWSTGTIYIIFLANVTETDFHIGFLYLTNSSNYFILRTFQYQDAVSNVMTFQGTQIISSKMVSSASVSMPRLEITAKAFTLNSLSVIGRDLYVNQNYGVLMNGTESLRAYPLLNQYFSGPTDYNELWALLTDSTGNYYFAIIYMQNNDTNHVIIEHQIRLNDYQLLGGRRLDVWTWKRGAFTNRLVVRLPSSNATIRVDGFPIQTDKNGMGSIQLPLGQLRVEVPNEIITPQAKLDFMSWMKFGSANPLDIKLNGTLDLTAVYSSKYPLVIESDYSGSVTWYAQNTRANFSVPSVIDSDNRTRRIFDRWEGDFNSTSNQGSLIVDSPKHIRAQWKTQFAVKMELAGAPTDASAEIMANGRMLTVNGSIPLIIWTDAGRDLSVDVHSTTIIGTTVNYRFSELRLDGQGIDGKTTVTRPLTIEMVYTEEQKPQGQMNVIVAPTAVVRGYPLTVQGSIKTESQSVVNISYSSDETTWKPVADIQVAADGSFYYSWIIDVDKPGEYFVRAYWSGDAEHAAASETIAIEVIAGKLPFLEGSSLIPYVRGLAKDFAPLSPIFSLATSLILLGIIIGSVVTPSSSVLGYLIGGLLLGFVFVFPISTIILVIRAVRTRRRPSFVWLTPLMAIWIGAMVLVSGGSINTLADASQILLICSSGLVAPLGLSTVIARTFA